MTALLFITVTHLNAQDWEVSRTIPPPDQASALMQDLIKKMGRRPWKFQVQYWNYVESPDAFSAEHQFRLSISPVVSAPWNKGK